MPAIKRFEYHCLTMKGDSRDATAILNELCSGGVRLTGFSATAQEGGVVQLDVAAKSGDVLTKRLLEMKLRATSRRAGFSLIAEGGVCAVIEVLERLQRAEIHVTGVQTTTSEQAGHVSALVWVEPEDAQRAAEVLDAWQVQRDVVDEASDESFPA